MGVTDFKIHVTPKKVKENTAKNRLLQFHNPPAAASRAVSGLLFLKPMANGLLKNFHLNFVVVVTNLSI